MPGTPFGARKGAFTNKKLYGDDFYQRIGKRGGTNGRGGGYKGGFADGEAGKMRASLYGQLGGTISRKGPKLTPQERRRYRDRFEKTYAHLLKINERANR